MFRPEPADVSRRKSRHNNLQEFFLNILLIPIFFSFFLQFSVHLQAGPDMPDGCSFYQHLMSFRKVENNYV